MIELVGENQWIRLRVEEEQLVIRVGKSPARSFKQFRLEFWHENRLIRSLVAETGMVHLELEDIRELERENAEQMIISV